MSLETDLKKLVTQKAKAHHVDPSWLKFAAPTASGPGFRFLPENPARDSVLTEICREAKKTYPDLTFGQIQDVLAGIVNKP